MLFRGLPAGDAHKMTTGLGARGDGSAILEPNWAEGEARGVGLAVKSETWRFRMTHRPPRLGGQDCWTRRPPPSLRCRAMYLFMLGEKLVDCLAAVSQW